MILVLMGVTSVGKTTLGKLLAAATGWNFEDADDYHSKENRHKMAAGIPLTDADREPWLKTLHERMLHSQEKGENAIFACSALRQKYREQLASGFAPREFCFIYLHATAALIKERIALRHHPYMNPGLLSSQLDELEVPLHALSVSVAGTPDEAVAEILAGLNKAGMLTIGNVDDPG